MREVDWLVNLTRKCGANNREMDCYIRKDGEFEQRDSMDAIGRNGWMEEGTSPYVR
jgi:hypothetical protein